MRQAEANLDALWASVDQVMQKKGASIDRTAVKKLLTLGRELQRTPEEQGQDPRNAQRKTGR